MLSIDYLLDWSFLIIAVLCVLSRSALVWTVLVQAVADPLPDVDEVLVGRVHHLVHQLPPFHKVLKHPFQIHFGCTALDVLWKSLKNQIKSVKRHLLYQLDTSVQLLPVTPLVLESRARKFLVILRAFYKLWEVVLARPVVQLFTCCIKSANEEEPACASEPMRLFHIFPPRWQAGVGVVGSVVVVHLFPLQDCPAGHCDGCPAPEDDHKVGVAAVVDKSESGIDCATDPVRFYTVSNVDPGST